MRVTVSHFRVRCCDTEHNIDIRVEHATRHADAVIFCTLCGRDRQYVQLLQIMFVSYNSEFSHQIKITSVSLYGLSYEPGAGAGRKKIERITEDYYKPSAVKLFVFNVCVCLCFMCVAQAS